MSPSVSGACAPLPCGTYIYVGVRVEELVGDVL